MATQERLEVFSETGEIGASVTGILIRQGKLLIQPTLKISNR
jgi:hypothetical protein